MDMNAGIKFDGKLKIQTLKDNCVTGEWTNENTMCIAGLSDIAAAIAYLGVQDIANNIDTVPAVITPIYGALGNGNVTAYPPSVVDTTLVNELDSPYGRTTASSSAFAPALGTNPAQVIWQFAFPINTSGSNFTITEAGIFALANDASGSGDMIDHAAFNPTVTWPNGQSLILSLQLSLYAVAW